MFYPRKIGWWVGAAAWICALALYAPDARAEATTCGVLGRPACPLQHFMRQSVAAALATNRLSELAEALEHVATLNPDPKHWQNWEKFARDGARAARARRRATAITACGRCHSIYRPEYNLRYRNRLLP